VQEDSSAETLVGDSESAAATGIARLERGALVGRYVVLDMLGRGGMGVVYAAFDPELDRKVAIKLLHSRAEGSAATGGGQLVREAQAMAKLSHPNVVTVHDVGSFQAHVFVAMEFVDGLTLRAWARAEARSWRDVVRVMLRAGRGLAAAHAVGLVHGDFKPDNVMIGSDERVRVMDFGLARRIEDVETAEDDGTSARLKKRLVVGTPGYVPPEQLAGAPGDALSDQFAFGVALWELSFGAPPFAGGTALEIATKVIDGSLTPPPRGAKVPGWVRSVVTRALSVDRNERFPTMEALLEALGRDPSRLRRRAGTVLAVTAAALGAFGWQRLDRARTEVACEQRREEIAGIWNAERREEVRAALIASGDGNASTTADRLEPWLDRHAADLSTMRTEICLAAERDGTVSAEQRRRTDECLDERSMDFEELVDAFSRANSAIVQAAVGSASALDLSSCTDQRALAQRTVTPRDSVTLEQVRELRRRLSRSEALRLSALYDDAVEAALAVREEARNYGIRAVAASASLRMGRALESAGRFLDAEQALREAYLEAGAVGADEIAEDAAIYLVHTVGVRQARRSDGLLWAGHAAMLRERRGESDDTLRSARLEHHLGVIDNEHGDRDGALEHHRRALGVRERLLGADHPEVATTLVSLAAVMHAEGDYAGALRHSERALAVLERALGPDHPEIAKPLTSVGMALQSLGSHEKALAYYERVLAIEEVASGPGHVDTASALNNVALTYKSLGRVDEAIALHRRALAIREEALGAQHPDVAQSLQNYALALLASKRADDALPLLRRALAIDESTYGSESTPVARGLLNLGNVLSERGELDDAIVQLERALAIWESHHGPDHPDVARTLVNIGNIEAKRGHFDRARALLERSLEIRGRVLSPEHPHIAYTLLDLAGVELASGRPADAIPMLERALVIERAAHSNPEVVASTSFALARALAEMKTDLPRARQLAEQARDVYRAAGEPSAETLAEVERWLHALQ
jgi:eukaryotic-like serine/threonine-protein kinase